MGIIDAEIWPDPIEISDTTSSTFTTGALSIWGGISIFCTSESTSITEGGGLSIAGGASIAKQSHFGDTIFVGGGGIQSSLGHFTYATIDNLKISDISFTTLALDSLTSKSTTLQNLLVNTATTDSYIQIASGTTGGLLLVDTTAGNASIAQRTSTGSLTFLMGDTAAITISSSGAVSIPNLTGNSAGGGISDNGTVSNLTISNLFSNNVTGSNIVSTNVSTASLTATNVYLSNATSTNLLVSGLTTMTNANVYSLTAASLTATSSSIGGMSVGTVGATAISAATASIVNVNLTNVSGSSAVFTSISGSTGSLQVATVNNLLATAITSAGVSASVGSFINLTGTNYTGTNSFLTNISASGIVSTIVNASQGYLVNCTAVNLVSTTSTLGSVLATNVSVSNVSAGGVVANGVSATNGTIANIVNTALTIGSGMFLGVPISAFSTDSTLGNNSDTIVSSQKAVKSYIDRAAPPETLINGFVDASKTYISMPSDTMFKIEPTGGSSYDIIANKARYTYTTALTVGLLATTGKQYVYFDTAGVLNCSIVSSSDLISSYAIVSELYFNATTGKTLLFGDERHGIQMDPMTHLYAHKTIGTAYESGLALGNFVIGNGSLNSHAQFGCTGGYIWDEDIRHTIETRASTSPLNCLLYLVGSDWQSDVSPITPTKKATTYLYYNQYTAGNWKLTECSNNNYVLAHVFASNNATGSKWIAIMGQGQYGTVTLARTAATTEINSIITTNLPTDEWYAVATLIYQTSAYANSYAARVIEYQTGVSYVSWIDQKVGRGAVGVTNTSDLVLNTLNVTGTTTLANALLTNATQTNAAISNETVTNSVVTNATVTNAVVSNGLFSTATIPNLVGTAQTFGSGVFTNVSATNVTLSNTLFTVSSTLPNAFITNATQTNAVVSAATIGGFVGTNASVTNATITNLILSNSSVSNLVATSASASGVSTTNIFGTNATLSNVLSSSVTTTNLNTSSFTAANGNLSSANVSNATISNAVVSNLTMGGLIVTTGALITNATVTNAVVTNMAAASSTVTNALFGSLTSASLRVHGPNATGIQISNNTVGVAEIGVAGGDSDYSVSALAGDLVIRNTLTSGSIHLCIGSQTAAMTVTSAGSVFDTNLYASNFTATTASIVGLSCTNVSVSNSTVTNLLVTNLTVPAFASTNVNSTNQTVTALTATSITCGGIVGTNASFTGLTATGATIPSLSLTSATASGVVCTNVNATNTTITNLFCPTASTISTLVGTNIVYTNGTISSLVATGVACTNTTVNNLLVTVGTIPTLLSTNINNTNITSSGVSTTNIVGTNSTLANIVVTTTASMGTLSVTNVSATNSTITSTVSTNATITNLLSSNAVFTNISSATLMISNTSAQPYVHLINSTSGLGATFALAQGENDYVSNTKKDDLVILNANTTGNIWIQAGLSVPSVVISSTGNIGLCGITAPSTQLHGVNAQFTGVSASSYTGLPSTYSNLAMTNTTITNLMCPTASTISSLYGTNLVYTAGTISSVSATNVSTNTLLVSTLGAASSLTVRASTNGGTELGNAFENTNYCADSIAGDAVLRCTYPGASLRLLSGASNAAVIINTAGQTFVPNLFSATTVSTNASIVNSTIANTVVTNSTIATLVSTNVSATNITSSNANITNLSSTTATLANVIVSTSASVGSLTSTNVSATNSTMTSTVSTNATITNLLGSNVVFTNISSATLMISNTSAQPYVHLINSTSGLGATFALAQGGGDYLADVERDDLVILNANTKGSVWIQAGLGNPHIFICSSGNIGFNGNTAPTTQIQAQNALFTGSITASSLNFSTASALSATVNSIVATNVSTTTLTSPNALFTTGITAGTGVFTNVSTTTLTSPNALFTGVTVNSIVATNVSTTTLTSPNALFTTGITAGTGVFTNVSTTTLTSPNALFTTGITAGTGVFTNTISLQKLGSPVSMTIVNNTNGNIFEIGYANGGGQYSNDAVLYDTVLRNTSTTSNILFQIGGLNSAMVIASSGNVGIGTGTTHPNSKLTVNGDILATGVIDDFGSLSDVRLKTSVYPLDPCVALNSILELKPVNYKWKTGYNVHVVPDSHAGTPDVGFIAQDIQSAIPLATNTRILSGEEYLGVKWSRIVPYLVGAIQELQNKIDSLQLKLQSL